MDKGLNSLLKWSIENSSSAQSTTTNTQITPLDATALSTLLNPGPSDAEQMRSAMSCAISPDTKLAEKLTALDNLEQLVEAIDNANDMENLGLWEPLVGLLKSEESEIRKGAAWCIGTAVQNNEKAQQKMLATSAIHLLVSLVLNDASESVRRKCIYALSSGIRNFQPAADAAVEALPDDIASEHIDSRNMAKVDIVINKLKERAKNETKSS